MRPLVPAGLPLVGAWVVAVAVTVSSCAAPQPHPTTSAQLLPAARSVPPDPRVGAVFLGGGVVHSCSAAVLASPSADLILTAAHCLADGVNASFVPGFDEAAADPADGWRIDPADGWRIDTVYLDPRWVDTQDPLADFAVARVSRADGARLESPAGDGLRLGSAPEPGQAVTVIGYPAGPGGGPAACQTSAAATRQGFPALRCDGVVAGFSGAPWITGATVSGLIGGLDGGGCAEETSYSPPFGDALATLVYRAQSGGPGDAAPPSFDDGCG